MKNQVSAFAIIGLVVLSGLLAWHSEHIARERDKAVKERNDAVTRVSELQTRESELQTSLADREDKLKLFQTKFEKTQEGIRHATPNECTDVAVAADIDHWLREQTRSNSVQLPGAAKTGAEAARYTGMEWRHESGFGYAFVKGDESCAGLRSRQENHS
jgi:hypothetical protein